jgi:hypothetical protein
MLLCTWAEPNLASSPARQHASGQPRPQGPSRGRGAMAQEWWRRPIPVVIDGEGGGGRRLEQHRSGGTWIGGVGEVGGSMMGLSTAAASRRAVRGHR